MPLYKLIKKKTLEAFEIFWNYTNKTRRALIPISCSAFLYYNQDGQKLKTI